MLTVPFVLLSNPKSAPVIVVVVFSTSVAGCQRTKHAEAQTALAQAKAVYEDTVRRGLWLADQQLLANRALGRLDANRVGTCAKAEAVAAGGQRSLPHRAAHGVDHCGGRA